MEDGCAASVEASGSEGKVTIRGPGQSPPSEEPLARTSTHGIDFFFLGRAVRFGREQGWCRTERKLTFSPPRRGENLLRPEQGPAHARPATSLIALLPCRTAGNTPGATAQSFPTWTAEKKKSAPSGPHYAEAWAAQARLPPACSRETARRVQLCRAPPLATRASISGSRAERRPCTSHPAFNFPFPLLGTCENAALPRSLRNGR